LLLVATAMMAARGVRAQQKAMRVLGFLYGGSSVESSIPRAALGRGLDETGYFDGENLRIVYRTSMEELIGDKAEVIIVAAGGSIRQAKGATTSIPLLFIVPFDPVSAGLVASLNRPGGNITGVSILSVELMPKRLQLLRELVPEAKTCAVLINPRNPGGERSRVELQQAADGMGLTLEIVPTRAEIEFEAAFAKIAALKAVALLVTTDPLFTGERDRLVALAARYAVPASYPWREFVLAGGIDQLRTEPIRGLSPGRDLRRQDPQRSEPSRLAGRTADSLRAGGQSQDREGAGPHCAASDPRPR
jgi:putative tryptophan/tyrosine transport system substrate-binding protein